MDNNFVANFKSEELEERLEFAKWSVTSEETAIPDENGTCDSVTSLTCTIKF